MTCMDSTRQQPSMHYLHPRYRLSVVKGGGLHYARYRPDGPSLTAVLEHQPGKVPGCFVVGWMLNVA